MATPDFVLELRRHVGTAPLSLVGVTAIIVRGDEVLLGRRSDNGALTPITGIVDPGEEPADAAVREALEEAAVRIRVDRLAWVHQMPRITYGNGDVVDYLDLVFRCTWVEGEPYPADGEMTEVGWYPLADLAGVQEQHLPRIEAALGQGGGPSRFEGGAAPA
ncbi:8-oxo-dGTP pyrophosphatase MutT (NUDIX family) [Agromyces terreus]|uniref:8-oxo-dGTP pyrophosphatase MutT (NUDIX family) n=1 Tax=Agromyces terreus TaxID=424795 RepID=A0A9X2GYE3_9MICO|nr:NUDIX domain-containing protein [Agromyces terreus]MCP2369691.1 8-oxo-dGTP pyrophosphatase MutT (NUDIX family) [Agromyces terreus]